MHFTKHLRQWITIVDYHKPFMTQTELNFADRSLILHRYPEKHNQALQAWDAGDEYLIQHVQQLQPEHGQHILILNDHFGALACWFSQSYRVTSVSDSYISIQGAKRNLENNKCQKVEFLTSLDLLPKDIDLVVMQIPKNNRYLSWQLTQLRKTLSDGTQVIAVNRVKDIHTSTLKLFEQYLGKTTTSLAWKKHRLVFTQVDANINQEAPQQFSWQSDADHFLLHNLSNVFSGESLDIGARFLLEHIPQDPTLQHIIDLGCGNGVLSVKAANLNPQAKVTCVDESFMAVESAKLNLIENCHVDDSPEARFQFIANNSLDGFSGESCDLVLCNPPFHQQNSITDHIAWQMFCDAKHVLVDGGRLLVIGNRHLRYDVKLIRLFGKHQVKTIAVNHKFVILQAIRR